MSPDYLHTWPLFFVFKSSSGKSDYSPQCIANWKHKTIAKSIIIFNFARSLTFAIRPAFSISSNLYPFFNAFDNSSSHPFGEKPIWNSFNISLDKDLLNNPYMIFRITIK